MISLTYQELIALKNYLRQGDTYGWDESWKDTLESAKQKLPRMVDEASLTFGEHTHPWPSFKLEKVND